MRFNLDYGRFDSRGLIERHQVFKNDVGQSDSSALTPVSETFHRSPGLQKIDATVINDISTLVSGIQVVSWLKREGGVDQVKIYVTDSKALATRVERRFDTFWPMIGIPQLRSDEYIHTGDCSSCELCL